MDTAEKEEFLLVIFEGFASGLVYDFVADISEGNCPYEIQPLIVL